MKVRFAAAVTAFLISSSSQAAVIVQNSELPSAVQSLFGATTSSSFNTTNMAAFFYTENSNWKWLIRYQLVAPSNSLGQSLNGFIWLSANQSYDLNAGSENFTLYTEKVYTPSSWIWGGTTLNLSLAATTLATGGGNGTWGLDVYNQSYSSGNLSVSNFYPCAAEGCNVTAQFNLIDLQYLTSGSTASLNFNPSDSRNLLLGQTSFDPYCNNMAGCSYQQQFYVQSVPLPHALWLLISGLASLGAMARKLPRLS